MEKISNSLLEKVDLLLILGVGDNNRLEHIKNTIIENKKVYNSDIQYVENLADVYFKKDTQHQDNSNEDSKISCFNCKNIISKSDNFCSFCGTSQHQRYIDDGLISSRLPFNPFRFRPTLNSYQILSIIGGFAALIPIAIAVYNIESLLFEVELYTGRDFSDFTYLFMAAGIVSGALSIFVIIIPFLIKKPKKAGKILFFTAFPILIISLGVGIVGFVVIILSSILALKKRYY
jgi:hypothetical protein